MIKRIFHILRKNRESVKRFLRANVTSIDESTIFLSFSDKDGYYLPYSSRLNIDVRQLYMVSKGLSDWLLEKYTIGNIGIRETDVVIDCGAFVGGFTVAATRCGAKSIYSIEPSSKNFKCLQRNIDHYKIENTVIPLNIGLSNKEGELKLNLSESGCDDSFLKPDEGDLQQFEKVKVTTLSQLIQKYKIDDKNLFLKVEAEGFEPEIIDGLGDCKPRVITVDITQERNGQSPKAQIESSLKKLGYQVEVTKRCLFAVRSV